MRGADPLSTARLSLSHSPQHLWEVTAVTYRDYTLHRIRSFKRKIYRKSSSPSLRSQASPPSFPCRERATHLNIVSFFLSLCLVSRNRSYQPSSSREPHTLALGAEPLDHKGEGLHCERYSDCISKAEAGVGAIVDKRIDPSQHGYAPINTYKLNTWRT